MDTAYWTWFFSIANWAIRIVMLLIVPQKRSSSVAQAWLLLIFVFPIGGLILFLIFGGKGLSAKRIKRQAQFERWIAGVRRVLPLNEGPLSVELGPDLQPVAQLADQLGNMPVLGGNSVELLDKYNDSIARLVDDIDGAQHHVHLLYYIFANDTNGTLVTDALVRAQRRGVECRVLADAMGSRRYMRKLLRKLRPAGVQAEAMWEPFSLDGSRIDLRNHRKIAVIDGRIGYTGSQNLVDAKYSEGIIYRELVARVTGPVVLELQAVLLADWFFETGQRLEGPDYYPTEGTATDGCAAQVLPSGPSYKLENNQHLFVDLLYQARERVVITTPYFIPSEPFLYALQTAVARGVEVTLIVSKKADQLLVGLAQASYYAQLLENGVHIYRYKPKFLHAKHMSVDDTLAVVGSSNMDIRSFQLNSEISLVVYDPDVARRMHALEAEYMANAEPLKPERWEQRSYAARAFEGSARLVSPLL
jgi:cardiolipin synthase